MKFLKLGWGLIFLFAWSIASQVSRADDGDSIRGLRDTLVKLAPKVDPAEAELLSATAHQTSRALARQYDIVLNPEFQNFLVNIGDRKRGYCAHYVRDMGARLRDFQFKTLVLHWGAAYAKSAGESNCLVVTARGQPFQEGIILDGWRRAGRLFWCPVREDHDYEIGNRLVLSQLAGPRLYSGITAWKEDVAESAWLQGSTRVQRKQER